jgi:hypothetical protein
LDDRPKIKYENRTTYNLSYESSPYTSKKTEKRKRLQGGVGPNCSPSPLGTVEQAACIRDVIRRIKIEAGNNFINGRGNEYFLNMPASPILGDAFTLLPKEGVDFSSVGKHAPTMMEAVIGEINNRKAWTCGYNKQLKKNKKKIPSTLYNPEAVDAILAAQTNAATQIGDYVGDFADCYCSEYTDAKATVLTKKMNAPVTWSTTFKVPVGVEADTENISTEDAEQADTEVNKTKDSIPDVFGRYKVPGRFLGKRPDGTLLYGLVFNTGKNFSIGRVWFGDTLVYDRTSVDLELLEDINFNVSGYKDLVSVVLSGVNFSRLMYMYGGEVFVELIENETMIMTEEVLDASSDNAIAHVAYDVVLTEESSVKKTYVDASQKWVFDTDSTLYYVTPELYNFPYAYHSNKRINLFYGYQETLFDDAINITAPAVFIGDIIKTKYAEHNIVTGEVVTKYTHNDIEFLFEKTGLSKNLDVVFSYNRGTDTWEAVPTPYYVTDVKVQDSENYALFIDESSKVYVFSKKERRIIYTTEYNTPRKQQHNEQVLNDSFHVLTQAGLVMVTPYNQGEKILTSITFSDFNTITDHALSGNSLYIVQEGKLKRYQLDKYSNSNTAKNGQYYNLDLSNLTNFTGFMLAQYNNIEQSNLALFITILDSLNYEMYNCGEDVLKADVLYKLCDCEEYSYVTHDTSNFDATRPAREISFTNTDYKRRTTTGENAPYPFIVLDEESVQKLDLTNDTGYRSLTKKLAPTNKMLPCCVGGEVVSNNINFEQWSVQVEIEQAPINTAPLNQNLPVVSNSLLDSVNVFFTAPKFFTVFPSYKTANETRRNTDNFIITEVGTLALDMEETDTTYIDEKGLLIAGYDKFSGKIGAEAEYFDIINDEFRNLMLIGGEWIQYGKYELVGNNIARFFPIFRGRFYSYTEKANKHSPVYFYTKQPKAEANFITFNFITAPSWYREQFYWD